MELKRLHLGVWFSVASSLSPLLHSSFRNKEMHEFMYININIIREISKIFKDTTFHLASWRSTDKHASCDISLGILVLLFFAPTWGTSRPAFLRAQLIQIQRHAVSICHIAHLSSGPQLAIYLLGQTARRVFPKKQSKLSQTQGAHLRCQPLETILQAPMYHSYPIQGTGGCHSTSSRFGGGFLYLDERLRKPKNPALSKSSKIVMHSVTKRSPQGDVRCLIDFSDLKNTSPNRFFWAPDLASHYEAIEASMASPVTGKSHRNSYYHPWILGKLCIFAVIHQSSSTSSLPPGAVIYANHAIDELLGSPTNTQAYLYMLHCKIVWKT